MVKTFIFSKLEMFLELEKIKTVMFKPDSFEMRLCEEHEFMYQFELMIESRLFQFTINPSSYETN